MWLLMLDAHTGQCLAQADLSGSLWRLQGATLTCRQPVTLVATRTCRVEFALQSPDGQRHPINVHLSSPQNAVILSQDIVIDSFSITCWPPNQ
jgi:hypothetical protein